MELTYDEYLKIGNGKEHLRVVLNNINVANSQLSNILSELAEAKKLLSDSQFERDGVLNDIGFAKHSHTERTAELDNRELSVSARENKVDTTIKLADKELTDIRRKITDTEIEHSIIRSRFINEKDKLVCEILELDKMFDTLTDKIIEYESTENEKRQECKRLENERIRLIAEKEDSEKAIRDFKRTSEVELELLRAQIEEAKKTVSVPAILLEEKSAALDRKRKNIETLANRVRKQFLKLNPDNVLPIELQ